MGTEGEGQGEELKGEPRAASSLSQASTFMFWREKGAGGSRGLSRKPEGQQRVRMSGEGTCGGSRKNSRPSHGD